MIINSVSWNTVNWDSGVWWFVWSNDYWKIENSSLVVNTVNWDNGVWWFVWSNDYWKIENSSAVVNTVKWGRNVWWFVWNNKNWTYTNLTARVLTEVLSWSVNLWTGYYDGTGSALSTTNTIFKGKKQEFFFGDDLSWSTDDGLKYNNPDNLNWVLYITQWTWSVSASNANKFKIEFSSKNYLSAFSGWNNSWWQKILNNLNKYWSKYSWWDSNKDYSISKKQVSTWTNVVSKNQTWNILRVFDNYILYGIILIWILYLIKVVIYYIKNNKK